MFEGLKTAVKSQRKLLVIFLITIFLPSVLLGIFGVIALRNEKFRLIKQAENEQLRIADNLKSRIESKIAETGDKLRNLSGYPSLRGKDFPLIRDILTSLFEKDSMVEHVFIQFENEEVLFPLFITGSQNEQKISKINYGNDLKQQIENAEDAEYISNDYARAAGIYGNAFLNSADKSVKASLLTLKARNLIKAGRTREAATVYSDILNNYPEEQTESGLPLELHAKLLLIDCLASQGKNDTAADSSLALFKEIIENKWDLNESRFKTYASIIREKLDNILAGETGEPEPRYRPRFDVLQQEYGKVLKQWQVTGNIRDYIVPEVAGLFQAETLPAMPAKFSKRVGNEDYLIETVTIPMPDRPGNAGILGVKLNSNFLNDNILTRAIEESNPLKKIALSVIALSGDTIRGNKQLPGGAVRTTAFFDGNFPPWRMELASTGQETLWEANIFSSFYFWTIITLIIILVFGSGLVGRIIVREMEILKIKSDFVSSVSHEFKTPLTAMKALTERLENGKVTQPARVKQYMSIISSDIERLIRLVTNILNFTKIEEGKKVYNMEPTDVSAWLEKVVQNYRKENFENGLDVQLMTDKDLPIFPIDREAMTQALFNLLDNAAKFSNSTKKMAAVTAGMKSGLLFIKIKDKGIGIRKEETDKIFEKFYRGKSAAEYSIKGTGLGLALVKYTVEAHNGKIDVGSEPEWKTVFTITLPISDKN